MKSFLQKVLFGLRVFSLVFIFVFSLVFGFTSNLVFSTNAYAAENIPVVTVKLGAEMTLQQAATLNGVTIAQIEQVLGVPNQQVQGSANQEVSNQNGANSNQLKTIGELLQGKDITTVQDKLKQLIIEQKLEENKNWPIIFTKLVLWALIILGSALLLRKKWSTPKFRLLFSLGVVVVLGFVLGSDPNPLGMIKDALYIYGNTGVVFKPRIIVAVGILITILIGSRLFCGWACHLGALQEIFYRIPTRKLKLPFVLTNLIRIIVFIAIIVGALGFGLDLLAIIDPYQIFNFNLAWPILVTVLVITLMGVFIYRPWCSLACPFGLLAWLVEKLSFYKVRFQPDLCSTCQACQKVCPTGRITALREGESRAECYSCGLCVQACPQKAISYGFGQVNQVSKPSPAKGV